MRADYFIDRVEAALAGELAQRAAGSAQEV